MLANDLEQVQNNSIAENIVKRNDTLQLISLSVGIYHIVEELNYACIPLGIVIFLMQGFASAAIIFNSKLRRKRTFLLICMLCISWTIVAAGEICSAVGTLVRYSLFNNCVITQYNCFIEQTSLAVGLLLVIDTNLLTAVDRCLAIITPHWYRKQYKLWMVYMVIFFAILHVFISRLQRFFNVSDILLPFCTPLMDSSEGIVKEQQIISNILLIITILLYFLTIILVKNQGISVRHDSDASKNTSAEKSETCSHSSVRILHSSQLILFHLNEFISVSTYLTDEVFIFLIFISCNEPLILLNFRLHFY
ncbi:hypothetical protein D917_03133 [Trichinella nativa]|uniref:G-protein coupled receptors family 1 profile domain-containing protein n=1 Tax=Trichinella nativa TaxID=6335 RepID=A0A1Y3EAG9_9BILA|nr:hypothetical protein D917_03133 [Trichinella nativa]